MPPIDGPFICVNGDCRPEAFATVPIRDHGFLYGDGAFEGMRVRHGRLFRPDAHFERLRNSLRTLSIAPPIPLPELLAETVKLVHRNDLSDCYIRLIVTRGEGDPRLDPRGCEPRYYILAYPMPPSMGSKPLKLTISSVVKKSPRSIGAHVKSLNYLDSILARIEAQSLGMDDGVLLDEFGMVAEASGANLFMVREGAVATPTAFAALPGVTRRTLIECCRDINVPIEERHIPPAELLSADEVFLCGTGAGIAPVSHINGRALPEAHPMAGRLAALYAERCADEKMTVPVKASVGRGHA